MRWVLSTPGLATRNEVKHSPNSNYNDVIFSRIALESQDPSLSKLQDVFLHLRSHISPQMTRKSLYKVHGILFSSLVTIHISWYCNSTGLLVLVFKDSWLRVTFYSDPPIPRDVRDSSGISETEMTRKWRVYALENEAPLYTQTVSIRNKINLTGS